MVRFYNDEKTDVAVVIASLGQDSWRGHVRATGTHSGTTYVDATGEFAYRQSYQFEGCSDTLTIIVDKGETTPGEYHN